MVKSIATFNPVFKQKYVNYDASTVNVDKEAINQEKTNVYKKNS